MIEIEKNYRKLVGKIGLTMIFFFVLFNILSIFAMLISDSFTGYMKEMPATVLEESLYIIAYLASFMLPVGFFKLICGKNTPQDMFLEIRLPGKMTFIYVFAGIAVVLSAAYINSYLVSIFDYGEFSEDVLWESNLDKGYSIVLLFISTAIVPAFCEEFLFRGMVLRNLLPYGKANAIIMSAVLFGLMHQNAEQILYTTIAGLVMGYVYVVTKSIWVTTLMHFFNNFNSVLQTVLYEKVDTEITWAVSSLIDSLIIGFGIICIVILIRNIKTTTPRAKENFYIKGYYKGGIEDSEEPIELPGRRATKLFFTPTIIIFMVLCIISAISLLFIGMFYDGTAEAVYRFRL